MTFPDFKSAAKALEQHKPDWSLIVRERLRDALSRLSQVHADDLGDDLPDHVRRGVVGAQIGGLVNRGLIVEVDRRKSARPQAHSRKSGVFELTTAGREWMAGVGGAERNENKIMSSKEGAIHPGYGTPGVGCLPGPVGAPGSDDRVQNNDGGGDLSMHGAPAVEPLFEMAGVERPSYLDADLES